MAEPSVRSTLTHMHTFFVFTSLYVFMTVLIIFASMWSYSFFIPAGFVRSCDARPFDFRVVAMFDPHLRNLSWYSVQSIFLTVYNVSVKRFESAQKVHISCENYVLNDVTAIPCLIY